MTQKTGKAGKSTYQMAEKRHRQGTFYLVLALGAVLVIYLLINNSQTLGQVSSSCGMHREGLPKVRLYSM